MSGNAIKYDDCDEEGVTRVSFTRVPRWMPLYWSKSIGVHVTPSRERTLKGTSRFITICGS